MSGPQGGKIGAAPLSGASRPSSGTGVKKLVVKNLSVTKLPDNYADLSWAKLQAAVEAVLHSQPVSSSLEELFQIVQDMCMHKHAAEMYAKLKAAMDAHVQKVGQTLVQELQGLSPENLLLVVDRAWQSHCRDVLMVRSIFLWLDRTYVLQTPGLPSIWDLGLELWLQHVAQQPDVQRKTIAGLLSVIERDRRGDSVDRGLLKSLLRMFTALHIYHKAFEGAFLRDTKVFYRRRADELMLSLEPPEYLGAVNKILQDEGERLVQYLDSTTRRPLVGVLEEQLIAAHQQTVLEKGFTALMQGQRLADLGLLYTLFARVGALDNVRKFFTAYIVLRGEAIVTNMERDPYMVDDLLALKNDVDTVVSESFGKSEKFRNATKDAFEAFINKRQNKPAECIAKYIDGKLRSGNKESTEEELDLVLDKVLVLFRFIQGKDVFEAFYKKDLAKRLLMGKSASVDAEHSMLSKLKQECGAGFTQKLVGMFQDMDISKDIMASFRQSKQFRALDDNVELYVNVLTTGQWPTYDMVEVAMPPELGPYLEQFQTFYLQKHSGRVLSWCHPLGHCLLRARFKNGPKELDVSFYQALVLLHFNDTDTASLEQIAAATKIEDKELRRTLQSLACGKIRVLRKEPKGKEINDGDKFGFADDFKHPKLRVKINQIMLKETVEENEATTERVFQDRQYQVDAAIVRIMKARKSLEHQTLLSDLFGTLKFPVAASDLKKRIESLIEREYLRRDENKATLYHYVA